MKRGKRLVVEAPRGYAKTTLVTVGFALYAICELGRKVEPYLIMCAVTHDQAKKYILTIKDELLNY